MIGRTPHITGEFRNRIGRAGLPKDIPNGRRLWLNAASVGETMAAIPFVEEWMKRNPNDRLYITNTTVTGYNRTSEKLAKYAYWHGFSPIDTTATVRRFIAAIKPDIFITVEAEAWPNLLIELGRIAVPRFLINGRMTLANKKGIKLRITSEVWNLFDYVIARSERDRDGYIGLRIPPDKLTVGGELKCDIRFPVLDDAALSELRARHKIKPDKCWIAASTHENEEDLAINVHKRVLADFNDAMLVIVPRRPERFAAVEAIVDASGLSYKMLSGGGDNNSDGIIGGGDGNDGGGSSGGGGDYARPQVLIVDAMGKLLDFYQACGLAVVCGSFYGPGVHSVLEPAAYGKPTLCGHRIFNTDIPERMANDDMLAVVSEPNELYEYVNAWYRGAPIPKKGISFDEIGQRAYKFLDDNRGASVRTVDLVQNRLELYKNR